MSTTKWLEKIVRGFSNHRRIQILDLLNASPGLSVTEISMRLKTNLKTTSEHLRRLTIPGLIEKRNQGANVRHFLSARGNSILKFLRTLE